MATEVLNFLPSEVARLVLGYLSDEGYVNSYKCFIKECPHLQEYLTLKRRGQNYPLHVNGLTLNQMLQEYAQYKLTDTQRRQTMGNAALWSQLDAVVRTLKEHTASKQNRNADGVTQSTRVRRMLIEKKRRRETERRQRKLDLCSKISATQANERFTDSSEKLGVGVTDSEMSSEEPPEAGHCGVLTPPTDTDTRKDNGRIRRSQEEISRRSVDTDNRETEFILHSAPPSVSSHHKNSVQRSNSVSDLLHNSAKKLHRMRGTVDSRIEGIASKDSDSQKNPKRMLSQSDQDNSGAIQLKSGKGESEDKDDENSKEANKIRNTSRQDKDTGENYDVFPSEQNQVSENIPDDTSSKKVELTAVLSNSVISFQSKKEGLKDHMNMPCELTRSQTMSDGLGMSSPKPGNLVEEQDNNIEVLGGVLPGLPIVESLQSSVEQPSTSKCKEMDSRSDQRVVQQTSSEENSQESSESGQPKTPEQMVIPFQQALNLTERMTTPFQQAINLTEVGKIPEAPHTPVKQTDETSQTNIDRTPRRKRLPKQKKNRGKGNSSLNDSNKSRDENSLLVENITLFFNELINNSLLHERLAANINKTLGLETVERRTRKKSEKLQNIPASPKSDKPEKPEIAPTPGESEPDKIQSVDLQEGLNVLLDDILNMNETQMTEVQIGGIIERTSKDPNFESLFNLFQEPHSASENQKTDFSGIKLEMGKEATITNQSLPSFTEPIDCPDPSNTTSEENLIMEILQSPQPGPSQNCSYQKGVLDQTTNYQKAETATNVSGMEWSPAHLNNNLTASTPTSTSTVAIVSWGQSQTVSRNIFESVQPLIDNLPSQRAPETNEPTCDQDREQTKRTDVMHNKCDSPKPQLIQLGNSVPLASGQDTVGSQQQPVCSSVVIFSSGNSAASSIQNCSAVAIAGISSGPVLSLINSVMSPSVRKEPNQGGSPSINDSIVPCQSPKIGENVKGQEVISSSPQPFTKLTNKIYVNVPCDVQQGKNSPVHSPAQRKTLTNQMLTPLQSIVPTTLHQSPKFSQSNAVQSPFHVSENCRSLALPHQNSGQSSTLSADSPQPNVALHVSDNYTDSQQPNVSEQGFQKHSEVISCNESMPSVKGTDSEKCNTPKNTRERSSHSKPGKVDKDKSSSKKARAGGSRSLKSSKDQISTDMVETFETSVSEAHGFPVISVKSVMKSPQEAPLEMDRNLTTVTDPGRPPMSYHSFINGVAGEECSTPVTERAGARDSPHTSHSTTNSGVFSEMMDFVSTLEKSISRESSSKKRSPKDKSGKRNSSKKKKEGKNETDFASPTKKCQWSPDLKALIKLVTPEKKGKTKGKKSKKVVLSADKRRNPKRKVRKSNEENIRKDNNEPEITSKSSEQHGVLPSIKNSKVIPEPGSEVIPKPGSEDIPKPGLENIPKPGSKVMPKPESEVITKSGSEVVPKPGSEVIPKPSSEVIPKPGSEVFTNPEAEVITKPGSDIIPKPGSEGIPKPEIMNNLSMPSIYNFMSPVQITSGSTQNIAGNISSEVGLTPKTVLTAVSALKDNNKPSSRKSLPVHQNTEQDIGLRVKEKSTVKVPSSQAASNALSFPARHNTEGSQQMNAVDQDDGRMLDDGETDYSKIPYSPNQDFLASPVRYHSPDLAVSHGNQYYEHVSSSQFDSPSVAVPHASQILTPTLYTLANTTSQNTPIFSDTASVATSENVYSSGMTYIQNTAPYQGQVITVTDPALHYNTVYIDSKGTPAVIQTGFDSSGQNVVPAAEQDIISTQAPVMDILSAAASVITSSPLETVDGEQLNSTPERKDKEESLGQLIAIPVGRYYPEKKLHVRSLDFGPDAGTVEIRKPGYGRGRKKKTYSDIKSPVKPGGLMNKQSKGKAKSKDDVKGKAKTDKKDDGICKKQTNVQVKVIEKKDIVVEHTELKNFEKDDLIPDASGSVYIVEGNTRKKIKLNKTPRPIRTVSPFFLPNAFDLASGIIPVRSEIYKKGGNITVPAGVIMPKFEQFSSGSVEGGDSDVDVDGDCELPDLSPEPLSTGTPVSKCSEYVQRTENIHVTPEKFSSVGVDNHTKKSSSVITISDSCDSNASRKPNSDSKRRTLNTGSTSVDSNPSSVRSFHGKPSDIYSSNSNSLPDLESPGPLINMSTPPKKRITASLKHGGGCYFFSTASQEGKNQISTVESRECDTTKEVTRVSKSPRTPKGKRTPSKAVRQSPRLIGSPGRLLRSVVSPSKINPQRVTSPKSVTKKKGVKRLREITPGEPSKTERKSKKARNGKRTVDLSKVDFDKFLNKIHKA
ncbi:protein NPAT-like [Saccostrea echinata]|uniref:protein NPAT-like n=1 Tax=Saccostrea echinata TaxID=191078 RepID=UPI002A81FE85|nr:protein NPAT-like [Saccostrea echinata]